MGGGISTRDGSSEGFITAEYFKRGKKKKGDIKFRLKGKEKKIEKKR